jgi:hypothetical protein
MSRKLVRFVPTPGWGSPGWMSWDDADDLLQEQLRLWEKMKACDGLSDAQLAQKPYIQEN